VYAILRASKTISQRWW